VGAALRAARTTGAELQIEPFPERRILTVQVRGMPVLSDQGKATEQRPGGVRHSAQDDLRLIAGVRVGDRKAFEALYHIYYPRLTRFLTHMVHQPQMVEEVLNDTMFVVWTRPDSFNGASRLSTWIFGIAYRKALNALRRRDEPIEDMRDDMRPSLEPGPDHQFGERRLQEILLRAIQGLSPDHRAVVDLTYFHEAGYREIAEIMDCPVDTVKTRMFHARRHLRRMLAGELADWL
jgi:RNA polymerase sigma factor (sigma-70 family)